RRERRPADVVVVVGPLHAGCGPLVARNPDPAECRITIPVAVVVRGPAVGLIRNPRPAVRRPHPAAVAVWAPARVRVRTPYPAEIGRHEPATVREIGENADVDVGPAVAVVVAVVVALISVVPLIVVRTE